VNTNTDVKTKGIIKQKKKRHMAKGAHAKKKKKKKVKKRDLPQIRAHQAK